MTLRYALIAVLALAIPAAAGESQTPLAPHLTLPLNCTIGRDCIVQKLFDLDPGPERVDYMCGSLTTDGHDGIDFRITDRARFRAGVSAEAAASGIVARTRDNEPDLSINERGTTGGRDAGNGVVIDHGGGWETQYSHLRRGSVHVHPGEHVAAGQPLGTVGLSGNTEYPHLHFSVRYRGRPIDPFTSAVAPANCHMVDKAKTLWTAETAGRLGYQPTVLAGVGFASSREGIAAASSQGQDRDGDRSTPLLLWAQIAGVHAGDIAHFAVVGSDGTTIIDRRTPIEKTNLIWLGYAGRLAPQPGWPMGHYHGRIVLERNHGIVVTADTKIDLR